MSRWRKSWTLSICEQRSLGFPEVSEVELIRHYTRLSTWNYHIDLGMYPLGSCTMKYNPKLNERVSRIPRYRLDPSPSRGAAQPGVSGNSL